MVVGGVVVGVVVPLRDTTHMEEEEESLIRVSHCAHHTGRNELAKRAKETRDTDG